MQHFLKKICCTCDKSLIQIGDDWYELKLHAHCGEGKEISTFDEDKSKQIKTELAENIVLYDVDFHSSHISMEYKQSDPDRDHIIAMYSSKAEDTNEYQDGLEEERELEIAGGSNEVGFSSEYCNTEFKSKFQLEQHINLPHQNSNSNTGEAQNINSTNITCEICNNVLSNQEIFDKHMLRHKGQAQLKRTYKCSFCKTEFVSNYVLRLHVEELHQNEFKYFCEVCNRGFTAKSSLNTHKYTHIDGHQFKCTLCSKTFRYKRQLNNHMAVHAGLKEEKVQCTKCDKSFASQSSLNCHVKFAHDGVSYICKTCGKSYSSKGALVMHEHTHLETFPFICSVCGKGFYQRAHLKAHAATHSEDRTHACKECDKKFKTDCQLKSHYRVHTGKKLYKCRVENCDRDYAHSTDFKRHQFNVHGICEQEHVCHLCSRVFAENKSLKKHLENHSLIE